MICEPDLSAEIILFPVTCDRRAESGATAHVQANAACAQ